MFNTQPPPTVGQRARALVAALAIAFTLIGLTGCGAAKTLRGASPQTQVGPEPSTQGRRGIGPSGDVPEDPPAPLESLQPGALGAADGEVPDGVTVFNDAFPAVTRLQPALLDALRRAAKDAAGDGVVFYVNSGWRSFRYQEQLFEQAVFKYGSVAEAAQWVARPGTSVHEAGGAVDLGEHDAEAWLSEHGAAFGLCQIYRNEPWHFELRPDASQHGCPAMYADPTDDPRLQQ